MTRLTELDPQRNTSDYDFIEELSKPVDKALLEFYEGKTPVSHYLNDAINYSLFASAKRFRPVLHIVAGQALGVSIETLLPTACSIELIHTYSLIHDDLPALDDDNMRRGKPTLHIAFGEETAIMAGDALYADAIKLILSNSLLSPEIKVRLTQDLAATTGSMGMVGGQMLDLQSSLENVDEHYLLLIDKYKTAFLISYCVRAAAIAAGADEATIKKFSDFGEHLGMAFQIVDDTLDITGDANSLGKETGSDIRKNKPTYASILGIDKAKSEALNEIQIARDTLRDLNIDSKRLFSLANFVVDREK